MASELLIAYRALEQHAYHCRYCQLQDPQCRTGKILFKEWVRLKIDDLKMQDVVAVLGNNKQ